MSSILESLNSYRHEMLKHRQKNNNLISSSKGSLFFKSQGFLNKNRKSNWSPVTKDHNSWKSKLGIVLSLNKNEGKDEESPNKIKPSVNSEGFSSHRSARSLDIWKFCSPTKRIKTYKVDSAKLLYDRVTSYLEKHFKSGRSNASPLESFKLPIRDDTYLSKKQRLENIKTNLEKKFQEREEKLKAKQLSEDKSTFFNSKRDEEIDFSRNPEELNEIELSHTPEELNEIFDIQLSSENKARCNETFNSNFLSPREYESTQLEDGFLDKISSDSISLVPPSSYSSRFDKERNTDSDRMIPISYEKMIGVEIICKYCFKVIIQAFDGFKNTYRIEQDDNFSEHFIFDKPPADYNYLEESNFYDNEETNIEIAEAYNPELDEFIAYQTNNKNLNCSLQEDSNLEQNNEIFEYNDIIRPNSVYNSVEEFYEIQNQIEYSIIYKPRSDYNYLEESCTHQMGIEYNVTKKPTSNYNFLEDSIGSDSDIEMASSIIHEPSKLMYLKESYEKEKEFEYSATNKSVLDFNYLESSCINTITYSILNFPLAVSNYLENSNLNDYEKSFMYCIKSKPISDCNYMEDTYLYSSSSNPIYYLIEKPKADFNHLKDYSSNKEILFKVFNKSSIHYNDLKLRYWNKFSNKRVISYCIFNKPQSNFNFLKDDVSYQQILYQALHKLNSHHNLIKKKYWNHWISANIFTLSSLSSENDMADVLPHKEMISKAINNIANYHSFLKAKYLEKWIALTRNSMLKEKSIRKFARSIDKSQGKLKFSFFLKLLLYAEKRKYSLYVFKSLFQKREKQIIDFWRQVSSKTVLVNNEPLFIEELNISTSHIDNEAVEKLYKPLEFLYKSKLRAGFTSISLLLIKPKKPPLNLSNISIYKYRMIKEKIEKFLACLERKASNTSNLYFHKWKSF